MAKRFSPGPSIGRGSASAVPRPLIVLCVASLALTVIGFREGEAGPLHTVRGAFQLIATPARLLGSAATQPFQGLSNIAANLTASGETLTELQSENEQLRAEVARLSEYEHLNESLMSLYQLSDVYGLQSTGARVISGSRDSWSSTVTIDKGSSSGLAVGMPVTTGAGVIGQISECGATTSVVRLITDEGSGVSAMVQGSRAQGQLVGSPDGTLSLRMVRTDQTVNVGDSVVTSGLGGVYPKSLPIGTVSNVTRNEGAMYYDITVEPLSSTAGLEEVLVITAVTEDQQASDDDARDAAAQDVTTQDQPATTDAAKSGDADGSPVEEGE